MEADRMYPQSQPWAADARVTFRVGLVALSVATVYFWVRSEPRTWIHLWLGLAQIILASTPALLWLRRSTGSLPVFEVLMLTGISTYALPLLAGHEATLRLPNEAITRAALAVLAFQTAAFASHEIVFSAPRPGRFWREPLVSEPLARGVIHGMTLSTVYALVSTFTTWLPSAGAGIIRAVFFGIGIVSTFLTARRLGSRELSDGEKLVFFGNLFVHTLAALATLFMVETISLLLLAAIGYVSSSRRVPLIVMLSVTFVLGVLHNGKDEMRERYWDDDERRVPAIADLPGFYSDWLSDGLKPSQEENESALTSRLIDRTSLFQIMCLVVSISPEREPYLSGETYQHIPAQFVPRLFWKDKPGAHISTNRLSVYYGLQTEDETQKTTIGFGMPAEAYANFGFVGVILIGVLLGLMVKLLQGWGAESPLLSAGGLLQVIVLAWSFQTEFTLSLWLTSLFQACVAVIGSLMFARLARAT